MPLDLVEELGPDRARETRVLLLVAERAHHAAAERLDLMNGDAWDETQELGRDRADPQALLVTMAVHDVGFWQRVQRDIELPGPRTHHQVLGDVVAALLNAAETIVVRMRGFEQPRIVVAHRRKAGGFDEQDVVPLIHQTAEFGKVLDGPIPGLAQHALA